MAQFEIMMEFNVGCVGLVGYEWGLKTSVYSVLRTVNKFIKNCLYKNST